MILTTNKIVSVFIALFLVVGGCFAQDPFAVYLTGKAPAIVQDLGVESDSVHIQKMAFHSRTVDVNGSSLATNVFAVIARPLQEGNYPALLVLHGGGGAAEIQKIRKWAMKGYIALSIDIPGVAPPDKVPNTSGNWKAYAYGQNRFTASPSISNSTIFDGALACVQALYLLRSQPGVIKKKVGITGISWGGYMTTIVSGLASQYITASFSTFGSGFYDSASVFLKELDKMPGKDRAEWLRYLDAGRRAGNITTPFFIAAATNDNWFYPPAVMATLRTIKKSNHFFAPNANHSGPVPGGNLKTNLTGSMQMEEAFFNLHLKDEGAPLPEIRMEDISAVAAGDNDGLVRFSVKSKIPVTQATLYYSTDSVWTKRKWIAVPVTASGEGKYEATLPVEVRTRGTWYFASVSDERPVTVSTYMKNAAIVGR